MRLTFDRGTLLLAQEGDDVDVVDVPWVLWDARVSSYRAPPFRHARLLAELRTRGVRVSDEATRFARLPDTPVTTPALRDYQQTALDLWNAADRKGVVSLPTGSGKTVVAIGAIAAAATSAMCLVPTRVLLNQWREKLAEHYRGPIGVFGDGAHEVEAITVATFESAFRAMGRIGHRFGLLIVDEAHHFGAGVRDEALEMCLAPARLGLTATPSPGEAEARLSDLLGPVVYRLGVADLAGGFLSSYEIVPVHVELDLDERALYETSLTIFREIHRAFLAKQPGASWVDFVRSASTNDRGRRALAAWRRARGVLAFPVGKRRALASLVARHRDARVLIFTGDNPSAYEIAREHLVMPLTCDVGPNERAAAVAAFREGRLRALVSAQVLNEGFDVPDADIAIIVAGRFGEREYIQRVGRLLRPAPGKRARIYDLVTGGTSEIARAARMREGLATRRAPAA